MTDEADALVEEALDAGILRRSGAYYYAAKEEGDDDYIGQGKDEALAWLEDNGYVEEIPEGEESDEPAGDAESEGGDSGASAYDASKKYRHEGDSVETFEREGRAPGHLYPGAVYKDLPADNDDIATLIGDRILQPIE